MKKIIFLALVFLPLFVYSQTQTDTIPYIENVTTHKNVRDKLNELVGVANKYDTTKADVASPTFTGTVTIPAPFTLGSTSVTSNGSELNILDGALVNKDELNYLIGTTSNIQDQADSASGRLDAIEEDTTNINDVALNLDDYAIMIADSTADSANNYVTQTQFTTHKADTTAITGYATQTQLDDARKDNLLKGIQNVSSPAKAITMCTGNIAALNTGMVDGIIYWLLVNLDKSDSITGIGFVLGTQGDYTADKNNKIGLYSISGTTYTLIDTSANNGNLWKASANTLTQVAFNGGKRYVTKGTYVIAILWNASATSAAPAMYASSNMNNAAAQLLYSSSHDIVGSSAGSDLPASIAAGDVGATTSTFNIILY